MIVTEVIYTVSSMEQKVINSVFVFSNTVCQWCSRCPSTWEKGNKMYL